MQIRKAQPSDFKCLVEIFTLNIPKYFHNSKSSLLLLIKYSIKRKSLLWSKSKQI